MMLFSSNARRGRAGRRTLAVALIVFFLDFLFPPLFPTIAYYLVSPIWWIERSLPSNDRKIVLSEQSLVDENYALRAQVENLAERVLTFNVIEQENNDLRGLRASDDSKKGVLAAVLAKPNVSPYDTIVIDAGAKQGIAAGDYVTAGSSFVIGRVVEAHNSFSKVVLLSSP